MQAAIYSRATGEIMRRVAAPASMIHLQCGEGEEFYLNCNAEATHIIDNTPVVVSCPDTQFIAIRATRNNLLSISDWTQMTDTPLTPEQKQAWAVYRQQLRDFPETCDPENPVWPVMPT